MKTVNENFEEITNYDLSLGYLQVVSIIKEDAIPIDDITKFAWADEDWENVQMYILYPELTIEEQILKLKQELASTDYKIIKCSECLMLNMDMPYDVATLHVERQVIRDKINALEAKL